MRLAPLRCEFRYLILTEHLPCASEFEPNVDKKSGPDIRVHSGSGVVVTAPPFNLVPKEVVELCAVPEGDGKIVTTAYRLK
jgi:hypothetical protein